MHLTPVLGSCGRLPRGFVRACLLALVGLVLVGSPAPAPTAGRLGTPTPARPLRIAASTPIFADIVANVGGERTEVWSVIPVGADPHTWEASPREIVRLTESDSFVFMGAFLEPFIEAGAWRRAAREAGISQLELADHVELIAVDRVIDHGDHVHDLRGGDPHVWLDPLKTVEVVAAIEAHLAELDPAGAPVFAANAVAYRAQLTELDAAYRAAVARIPPERRKLVVFHDAYTYFAARYGFEVVGTALPLSTEAGEPSAAAIAELVDRIEAAGVPAIFVENVQNPDLMASIAAEAGVELAPPLYTDALGPAGSEGATYVDMMRSNVVTIVTALGAGG